MSGNVSTTEAVLVIGLYKDPLSGKILTPLTRSGTRNPSMWRSPGGGLEEGETVHNAALREVKEEVGLEVDELHFFKTIEKPSRSPLYKKHTQHVLVGTINSISEFRNTAQDGHECLMSELFDIERIRRAVEYRGLLSHYEILWIHSLIYKELFDKLFGKL